MRRRLQAMGALGHFSVLSLVFIAVLGLLLAHILRGQIESRALRNARQSAQQIARLGVQPQLSPQQLAGGLDEKRYRLLDKAVSADLRTGELGGLRIWTRSSRILYAEDHALIGKRFDSDAGLLTALEGRISSGIGGAEGEGEEGGARGPKYPGQLLEVYVPLRFSRNEPPAGAFELYLPYAPVAASISKERRTLYLALVAGMALLYLGLFPVMASASRRLRRQAAENKHQAFHDSLTDLPNRNLFQDRTEVSIRASRRERTLVAVLLIDLDRFKEVNDTLGHRKGDVLLKEVGLRLQEALRESDTVARLGGDEFGVLLPRLASRTVAVQAAERIRDSLGRDFVVDGLIVDVDASIGIAMFPEHGDDVDTLLQHADVAMYEAKRSHGGYEIYAAEKDPYSPVQLALVGELRKALDGDEVVLHYQPKVDLQSGEILGVEALVRWEHRERGLIPPIEFIPMAEHTGLIRPLTRYVLNVALGQSREWQERGLDLLMSVNLSARNLLDPSLPEDIASLLAKWSVGPRSLELEITESTIMVDPALALDVLNRLHAMGIALAIDDFGTGYSSLAYLKQLPVSELKIDKTFVMSMASNESDAFIVRSAIELGHNLGLQVVAEGVEDEETLRELSALGCNFAQGYHLSRPVPPEELAHQLAEKGRAARPARQIA